MPVLVKTGIFIYNIYRPTGHDFLNTEEKICKDRGLILLKTSC